jgi:Carboxypeptidase regulatory-like domain
MTIKTAKVGVLSIAAVAGVCRIMAQALLGAAVLSGRIRDVLEAPVGAAKIVLTEKSKGLVRESLSDNSGSFLFPSMSAGIYEVQATKEGFSTHQVDDLKDLGGSEGSSRNHFANWRTSYRDHGVIVRRGCTRHGVQRDRHCSGFREGTGPAVKRALTSSNSGC